MGNEMERRPPIDMDGNEMFHKFSCDFCGNVDDYLKKTVVKMSSSSCRFFNREFFICEKCACKILEKAIERDPMNSRCNKG